MLTLKFYTIKEKKPKIGESVIFLNKRNSFSYEGFEPMECTVQAYWLELTNGEYGGYSIRATRYGKKPKDFTDTDGSEITYVLQMQFGEYFVDDNTLWCSVNNYWKALDKAGV